MHNGPVVSPEGSYAVHDDGAIRRDLVGLHSLIGHSNTYARPGIPQYVKRHSQSSER